MAGTTGRFFPVVGVSLGEFQSFDTFNASALSNAGIPPYTGQLGSVFEKNGKVYRMVKFDNGSAVAAAAGGVAHWKTRADYVVTSDQTDAEASLNSVAGGFLMIVTDLYYCFVQIGGVQAVITDTTATAGTALIASTTDLTLVATTTNTKGNQLIYGISYGTNTTTSANVYWVFGNLL
tara:strand:+ start:105 stop:638 length:534 start_codon:yes stop_codon:yes gene_type:complete